MSATDNSTQDISEQLQDRVEQCIEQQQTLNIRAGGSKDFYGRKTTAMELNISQHQGIISYEPTELVITARAGTPIHIIEKTLAEQNQRLAFEPANFNQQATLGGTLATNFSGPRRAYAGAARDFVLGTKILNGQAEILSFGGQVMKNVAGYDVSRLMTGSLGTLGIILEASIKVVPIEESEITLALKLTLADALKKIHEWSNQPLPISASCFYQDTLYLRLSGAQKAIQAAEKNIGGDTLENANSFWQSIKEQSHEFFSSDKPIWRLSLASDTEQLALSGDTLYEWGGALRWLKTDEDQKKIRRACDAIDAHATAYLNFENREDYFHPLPEHLLNLHKNIKHAFDPHNIFNIARMYRDY